MLYYNLCEFLSFTFIMNNRILIPLFASTVIFGCQDSKDLSSQNNDFQDKSSIESKKIVPQWVGNYQGTTPCMGCSSRCEDCPGMAVDLKLNEDMTYVLQRESLSGHNEVETLQGKTIFKDEKQSQIELMNVKTRNKLYVDLNQQFLEILEDKSSEHYMDQEDFILGKV